MQCCSIVIGIGIVIVIAIVIGILHYSVMRVNKNQWMKMSRYVQACWIFVYTSYLSLSLSLSIQQENATPKMYTVPTVADGYLICCLKLIN